MANHHTVCRFGADCDFNIAGFVYWVNRVPINFDFAYLFLWAVKKAFSKPSLAPCIYRVAELCRANLILTVAKVHIIDNKATQNKGDKHNQPNKFYKSKTEINGRKQQNSCKNLAPEIVAIQVGKSHL